MISEALRVAFHLLWQEFGSKPAIRLQESIIRLVVEFLKSLPNIYLVFVDCYCVDVTVADENRILYLPHSTMLD